MNKKFMMVMASGLLAFTLAGCPGGETPAPEGSDEGRQAALATAKGADIAANNAGQGLLADDTGTRNRLDYGASLSLLKQYTVRNRKEGVEYVVNISWDYDRTTYGEPNPDAKYSEQSEGEDAKVKKWETDNQDELKYYCSFAYDSNDHNFEFTGTLSIGTFTDTVKFLVVLSGREMKYKAMSLSEFYEVGENDEGKPIFANWMQTAADKYGATIGDYTFDHGTKIVVKGKVTYVAGKDKNFAYISDGDKTISLYHVDWAGDVSLFTLGAYVETACYISSYNGAPQLSNMSDTKVYESAEALGITEPVTQPVTVQAVNLTGTYTEGGDRFSQYSDNHYRMVKLTGRFVKSSMPANPDAGKAFTFKVKSNEGVEVKVTYNYHTGIGAGLIETLNGIADGEYIVVKGALTYKSTKDKNNAFNPGNEGEWEIVPISADDVYKDQVN